MHPISMILGRRWHLAPATTRKVIRERDLPVPMDDGVVLLADRWVAESARDRPQPTVLVRSCYGRGQTFGLDYFYGLLYGRLLAERGLQVVMQSVRGTFGSEGTLNPFYERADGLATLRWLRAQPWHEGPIGMAGQSYLGLAQWAIAAEADDVAALSIQGSASQFHGQTYPHGSRALETSVQFLVLMSTQERRPGPLPLLWALHRLRSVLSAHSLRDLDLRIAGREVPWFRDAQSHTERDDEWWMERDFSAGVPRVEAAVQMITGWYDAFTPWQLEDFAALQQAGRRRQLIIGPWTHTQEEMAAEGVREGVAWLGAHLRGEPHETAPVRIFVTGDAGGWRELERWPPDGYAPRRLWLAGDGHLAWTAPETAGRRRYRYDPADPTPSAGGPVMITGKPVIDNRKLESRADVITFTSAPLDATVEAIGTPRVELFARASEPHFDLFARVCDVDRDGASWNVCDALASVTAGRFHRAEDDVWQVEFDLWPIAHRFAAGHRIRLQISSGAHPRYIRNPGTGEDPFTAETLRAVDVELVHGPEHPSCVLLPIACPS